MTNASEARIADDLVDLTEALEEAGWDSYGGGLGGTYGYGTHYENDVFEMHPYFWGDCECGFEDRAERWENTHLHDPACYQQVIRDRGFIGWDDPASEDMDWEVRHNDNDKITYAVCLEMGLSTTSGTHVHCTCPREPARLAWLAANDHESACGVGRPNFLHKPTRTRVDWYKYIGRSMEHEPVSKEAWRTLVDECVASITRNPDYVKPEPVEPMTPEQERKWAEENIYIFEGSFGEVMQQVDETFHPVSAIQRLEDENK